MKIITTIFPVLLLLMSGNIVQAQFLKKLEKKVVNTAEKAVERKAEQKTEAAVNKALDKSTDAGTYKGNRPRKNRKIRKPESESKTDTALLKEEKQ